MPAGARAGTNTALQQRKLCSCILPSKGGEWHLWHFKGTHRVLAPSVSIYGISKAHTVLAPPVSQRVVTAIIPPAASGCELHQSSSIPPLQGARLYPCFQEAQLLLAQQLPREGGFTPTPAMCGGTWMLLGLEVLSPSVTFCPLLSPLSPSVTSSLL